MKITLIMVGKTNDKKLSELIENYITRTNHYTSFTVETVPDVRDAKSMSREELKQREGAQIARMLKPGDFIILLDERGKERSSTEFAQRLQKLFNAGHKRIVFIIGGAFGFSPEIYAAANEQMSLSKMTFSHQMVRLIFVEQLYRAHTILNGEPYHHE